MSQLFKSMLLLMSITLASPAFANTEQYGTLLKGTTFQPYGSFASLSVTPSFGNSFNFTLTANNLGAIFTPGAFIGAIAVDVDPYKLSRGKVNSPTISGVSGGSPVTFSNGGGPTGLFDFRFDLTGPNQARLTSGESVSWVATFAQPTSFTGLQFALHVQGLTVAQGGSGFYDNGVVTAPVPEPATYAMMLMGLGLVGFMAKRRKS